MQLKKVTVAYAVAVQDDNAQINLGGAAFYTVSLGPAANYPPNFAVTLANTDAGRGKRISPSGGTSFILWPGQVVTLSNPIAAWVASPAAQRWKAPQNTTVYIDVINGNDLNDGLLPFATSSNGPVQTMNQGIRTNIKDYFDLSGASAFPTACVTVQLANSSTPYSLAHVAFNPVGNEGRNCILIQGNAANSSACVIADASGSAIGVFGGANVEVRNLQIGQTSSAASPVANGGLEASDASNLRMEGGVAFGYTSGSQMQATNHGTITSDGAFSVTGGGNYLAFAQNQGIVAFGSQTVTFSSAGINYAQQTISALELSLVKVDGVTWTNSSAVTGTKYFARNNSVIETDTGNGLIIPGSSAGASATTGAQVG